MKTPTMNSLTSVAPTFAGGEPRPEPTFVAKCRLGTVALCLALVGVGAVGAAVISQTPAVAREMAAVKSSLRMALQDAGRGNYGYGASAEYVPGQFSAEQLQQPFPTAQQWEVAGFRSP